MTTYLLKLKQVSEITTLSRASIYRLINEGAFPTPIKLSKRAVAWQVESINNWLNSRAQTNKGANHDSQ